MITPDADDELEDPEESLIYIDDVMDGEGILLSQTEDGYVTDQVLMNRQAAIEAIDIIKEMLGI